MESALKVDHEDHLFWTHERTRKLITLYEQQPSLYNSKLAGYSDRKLKYSILELISKEIQATVEQTTKKIKGLRTQYSREKYKLLQDSNAEVKWVYYKILNFLDEFITIRRSMSDDVNFPAKAKRNKTSDHGIALSPISGSEEAEVLTYPSSPTNEFNPNGHQLWNTSKTPRLEVTGPGKFYYKLPEPENEDIVKIIESHNSFDENVESEATLKQNFLETSNNYAKTYTSKTCSSCNVKYQPDDEIFGKYITSELKQINNLHLKRIVKNKIQNIIFEAHCASLEDKT